MWSDTKLFNRFWNVPCLAHLPTLRALFLSPLAHLMDSHSLSNIHLPTTPATERLPLWAPSWHSHFVQMTNSTVCLFHWAIFSLRTRAFSFTEWVFNKSLWAGSCKGPILSFAMFVEERWAEVIS